MEAKDFTSGGGCLGSRRECMSLKKNELLSCAWQSVDC
jgi:hypothetical protein